MASQRRPLSFPEFEGRGRRAILRTPEEVQAEQELLASQHAGKPENQTLPPAHDSDTEADRASASMPPPADQLMAAPEPFAQPPPAANSQKARKPESEPHRSKANHIKVTYRLSPVTIDAIEDAKRILRRQYNIKALLEDIAEEAIIAAYRDLLENQTSSNLAQQLSRKPANKKARNAENR